MYGNSCANVTPCGTPALKNAGEYLTLAYAGGCPGRFDVGCQIPMRFSFPIPVGGATVEIAPKQPNQPVALIADRSGAGLVLASIVGPDGKTIGMEGDGISGVPYDLGEFTNGALRGNNTNPFPQNVPIITSTNGLEFVFGAGLAVDFRGILYGFVPGMDGIKYAQKCGLLAPGEYGLWQRLAQWQETGEVPPDLMRKLERMGRRMNSAIAEG